MKEKTNDRPPFSQRLTGFLKTKKGQRALIIFLIIAAAAVVIADLVPEKDEARAEEASRLAGEEYGEYLEQKLKPLLESMSGVGECEIMITLTGTGQTEYVSETKENEERDKKADGSEKTGHQKEGTYIIIDDGNGGQTALSRGYIMPEIGGVVVVCDGGEEPAVREKIVNAVKTALKIGSDRIFVTDRE